MKTKAEIVQRLLEAKQIDAEEAVVLLMADTRTIHWGYPYNPVPNYPTNPFWYCNQVNAAAGHVPTSNFEFKNNAGGVYPMN